MGQRGWGAMVLWAALTGCHPVPTIPIVSEDAGVPPNVQRDSWLGIRVPAGWIDWPIAVVTQDGGTLPTGYARQPALNPIPAENQRPGDPTWLSGRQPYAHQVELYASTDSAEVGDTVTVRASTDVPSTATVQVFRLGYYGGMGARRLWSGGPYNTFKQAPCPADPATERVECHWSGTFSFTVGADWVSGVYLVKVARADGFRAFTYFVVRDHRAAELLFQRAMNTDEAYNSWGGESLYYDSSGTLPTGMAHAVSFDRPFAAGDGAGNLLDWEYWLLRFIEQNGYDVTYGTNQDLSRFPDFVSGVGAFIAGGHDEYWVQGERDQLDAALAAGNTSFAYFGANGGYWRSRYSADSSGEPLRTLTCYKGDPQDDPIPYATGRFRDAPNAQPESELYGVMYSDWLLTPFSLVVSDASHWLFAGTGLQHGDQLYGVAGYEYDNALGDASTPPGFSTPLQTPMISAEALPDIAQAATYPLPSGTSVFAAGSIYWPLGLSTDPATQDGRMMRMTLNVLERALAHRRAPRTLSPAAGPVPSQGPTQPVWARSVAAFAGVEGPPASVDGPAALAHFNGPTGVVVRTSLQVVVTDTGGNQIRLIDTDAQHTVKTIAGTGALGLVEGPGAQAMFRRPTAVVEAPDGSLLVADSDNHCIRRIGTDAAWTVTTYAGGARQAGHVDGAPSAARFNRPTALAIDAAGNLYVADQVNNRIRLVAAGTRLVTTLAGSGDGFQDAPVGTQALFNNPSAIALGPAGQIYVFDAGNQAFRAIAPGGTHAVTTLVGDSTGATYSVGYADGWGTVAKFRAQMGMAVGSAGEVILGDAANYRLRKVIVGADAPSTNVYTIAGSGQVGTTLGTGDVADVVAPAGITYAPNGQLFVSDSYNNVIRIITR